ncbi:hypothetical protein [Stenotrophomonas sp. NRRL B-14846]
MIVSANALGLHLLGDSLAIRLYTGDGKEQLPAILVIQPCEL